MKTKNTKPCPYCLIPGSGIMSTGSELDVCFCKRDVTKWEFEPSCKHEFVGSNNCVKCGWTP